MRHIVLLGRFTRNHFEEPHVLYCGLDGEKSLKAASDARATGKYQDGGKIFEIRNVMGRPFPVVPVTTAGKVPGPFEQAAAPLDPSKPNAKEPQKPKQPNRMKSQIKTALALVSCAVLLIASSLPVNAQGFGSVVPTYGPPVTLITGVSIVPAGGTSNGVSAYIDCRSFQNVALAQTFAMSGATTMTITLQLLRSVDKVNWDTLNPYNLTLTANGTNVLTWSTNVNVGGFGWLKVNSYQNNDTNSRVFTNLGFVYSIKRSAP